MCNAANQRADSVHLLSLLKLLLQGLQFADIGMETNKVADAAITAKNRRYR